MKLLPRRRCNYASFSKHHLLSVGFLLPDDCFGKSECKVLFHLPEESFKPAVQDIGCPVVVSRQDRLPRKAKAERGTLPEARQHSVVDTGVYLPVLWKKR